MPFVTTETVVGGVDTMFVPVTVAPLSVVTSAASVRVVPLIVHPVSVRLFTVPVEPP